MQFASGFAVGLGDLIVEGPEIIQVPDAEDAAGQQVDDPDEPFSHVEPVNAEKSEKGKQYPRD